GDELRPSLGVKPLPRPPCDGPRERRMARLVSRNRTHQSSDLRVARVRGLKARHEGSKRFTNATLDRVLDRHLCKLARRKRLDARPYRDAPEPSRHPPGKAGVSDLVALGPASLAP